MVKPVLTPQPFNDPRNATETIFTHGCEQLIRRLNDSLATELACVLYYNQRPLNASGLVALREAEMPLPHSLRDLQHVDRLARRVVQFGGIPGYPTDPIAGSCHAAYDSALDLSALIKANLTAEHAVIDTCQQLIDSIDSGPSALLQLLQALITGERSHMDKLTSWFDD